MSEWWLIEQAPTGVRLLLSDGEVVEPGLYSEHRGCWVALDGGTQGSIAWCSGYTEPTYFMPFPEPPE